jgi:8-oxo-dGTP pyrophosphatase MutT (NUDIX family)
MQDTSFKGVVFDSAGRVLLGRNKRQEWELLGGRAEPGDDGPEATIRREVLEETGLSVEVGSIIDVWYYEVADKGRVTIASYFAELCDGAEAVASHEHSDLAFFAPEEVVNLNIPDGYVQTVSKAASMRRTRSASD